MKALILISLLPVLAYSAILPDTIGEWKRGDVAAATAPDAKVWTEYGLQESETAPYTDPANKQFSVTAYRFSDSTGSFAAWNAIRPADAIKIDTDGQGLQTPDGTQYIEVGNLLLVFHGIKPDKEQLAHIFLTAPHYNNAPLSTLPGYLPAGAIPNSERYILGPDSLAAYAPAIPSSTAAFHFSSEAMLASYNGTTVVIFNFPAIEMAQKQYPAFEAIPGAVAKRTGPLVAVALHPTSPDAAERLLSKIKFQAEVTLSEKPPTLKDNPANLFLNIMILCGVIVALFVVAGLVFGGIRHLWGGPGSRGGGDEMITLHLTGKQ